MYCAIVCSMLLLCTRPLTAQSPAVLYREILQPDAITLLDSISMCPVLSKTGFNLNGYPDQSMPGYDEMYAAYDAGVFTFMWFAPNGLQELDTNYELVFKRDEEIICQGTPKELFGGSCDALSNVMAYRTSGAWRVDLQIPFQRMFRISQRIRPTKDYVGTFWSVYFRMLPPSVVPPWKSTTEAPMSTTIAEVFNAMQRKEPPLPPADVLDTLTASLTIAPFATTTLLDLDTAGTIYRFYLDLARRDTTTLDSLRIRITWDDDIHPAIDLPCGDLFNAGAGVRRDSTWFTSAPENGFFRLAFPMPFAHHARITVTSSNADPVQATVKVAWRKGAPLADAAYLHAQFFESKRTVQFKPNQAAIVRGRGKMVGTHFATRQELRGPSWLEGDVFFRVNGSRDAKVEYWGIEDYYTGGWFFTNGPFSGPFSGCPHRFSTLYRYHVLDGLSFDTGLNAEFGHGCKSDFPSAPRIATFYYLQHQHFDVACDSVRAGAPLRLHLRGNGTDTVARITLDSMLLATIPLQGTDLVDTSVIIPAYVSAADHILRVNGEAWRAPITVQHRPVLRRLDPAPERPVLAYSTFPIAITGCMPKESVDVIVAGGTIVLRATATADGTVHANVRVPDLPAGSYTIAMRTPSITTNSEEPFTVTRTFNFECEDLAVLDSVDYTTIFYTGFRPEPFWSDGKYRQIDPPTPDGTMTMIVPIANSGLYKLDLWGARGSFMGVYDVHLDDVRLVVDDFYAASELDHFERMVVAHRDTIALTRGYHTMRITCGGKNLKAARQMFVADNLELTPIGNTVGITEDVQDRSLMMYPVPARAGGSVHLRSPQEPTDVCVIDVTGRMLHLSFTPTASDVIVHLPADLLPGVYGVQCTTLTGSITVDRLMITQ